MIIWENVITQLLNYLSKLFQFQASLEYLFSKVLFSCFYNLYFHRCIKLQLHISIELRKRRGNSIILNPSSSPPDPHLSLPLFLSLIQTSSLSPLISLLAQVKFTLHEACTIHTELVRSKPDLCSRIKARDYCWCLSLCLAQKDNCIDDVVGNWK